MNRTEMIEILVNNDLLDWYNTYDKNQYFESILRKGFIGYETQTNTELVDELYYRGLCPEN